MNKIELGPRSKEALSWMIISEVLRQSALDLDIAVLHPGGGQYDTLSLVTYSGDVALHVNRNGANALAGGELVEGIFPTAAKSPEAAAKRILRHLTFEDENTFSANRRSRIATSVRIANFLAVNLRNKARCEWAWVDSTYGTGPNSLLNDFVIPDYWREQKELFRATSWQSCVFLLFRNDSPHAAINMVNGEIRDVSGKIIENLVSSHEVNGLLRSHMGLRMIWKDAAGKVKFDDEILSSQVRMTRRNYSEEYYTLPEETVLFGFSCDEDEAVAKWNMAEGVLDVRDYLS